MARTKRRIYQSAEIDFQTGITPSANTGFVAMHHLAPNSLSETFLRGRMEATVTVQTTAPHLLVPPDGWWAQTYIDIGMWWLPNNSATFQPFSGTSVDYLGSVRLLSVREEVGGSGVNYTVAWNTKEPLIVQTARKAVGNSNGPGVLFEVYMHDPNFVFSNGWADTNISSYIRGYTLWEDP